MLVFPKEYTYYTDKKSKMSHPFIGLQEKNQMIHIWATKSI